MIKVTVKINDSQVTIEGPEDFVREEVRHLTSRLAGHADHAEGTGRQGSSQGEGGSVTEAQIIEQKKPGNHSENVAVLAYCMKQSGIEEFTEDDMRRAYIRSKVRPPKVVGQAIRDAKNKCDYIEEGSSRGLYRLSHHGERTVLFDMPRS